MKTLIIFLFPFILYANNCYTEQVISNGGTVTERWCHIKGELFTIKRYSQKTLIADGQYDNGLMVGKWIRFYKNGKVMDICNWENDVPNGVCKRFNEDGTIVLKGRFSDGEKIGWFEENGKNKFYDYEAKHTLRIGSSFYIQGENNFQSAEIKYSYNFKNKLSISLGLAPVKVNDSLILSSSLGLSYKLNISDSISILPSLGVQTLANESFLSSGITLNIDNKVIKSVVDSVYVNYNNLSNSSFMVHQIGVGVGFNFK